MLQKKQMSYRTSIYGKNSLSGQLAYTTKDTKLDAIYGATGSYSAMIGLDFSVYSYENEIAVYYNGVLIYGSEPQ